MGKVTGFLEFDRHDRDTQPVAERIKHWHEFVLPLPEKELRDQARALHGLRRALLPWHQHVTGAPTGCPVNNQIPDWNDLVYRANWDEAARNLHSTNNFPEFTGRVCPAPCEASCTLNIDDNPVTIKTIECEIADRAIALGLKPEAAATRPARKSPSSAPGRPAWLAPSSSRAPATTCMSMRRWAKAGGLLRYGIPDFKMEKIHVDRRVAQMEAEGVRSITAPMSASICRSRNCSTTTTPWCLPAARKSRAICRCRAANSRASISPWISCRSRTGG